MNKHTRKLARYRILTAEAMSTITNRSGQSYSGSPRGYQVLGPMTDRIWVRFDGTVWSWSESYLGVDDLILDLSEQR